MKIILAISGSTIDSLTFKLTNKIDEKLQSFKGQIVEEQSSRLDSAVKRFKKDGYVFKKEGNRQMYEHEEKVMEVLVEVKAVTKNDTVVAVQKIEEGMSLVKNRMKMIKVADRSQYGWSTVKEYEQGDLASNSEDEKRLTRSEKQAERKVKALLAKHSRHMNKRFEQVPASRIEGQSSSPWGNSWAGGFLNCRLILSQAKQLLLLKSCTQTFRIGKRLYKPRRLFWT